VFTSNATDEEIEALHKYISNAVRKARELKGMSQLELSLTIGLKSAAFFGNAENNTRGKHFNIEHLYKISKALEIPMNQLMPEL
jgi:transcriptional regulator with XRE-family HTH domain